MKNIKVIGIIISCMLLSSLTYAQGCAGNLSETLQRKNAVDVTLGGTGLAISVNYNKIILVKPNYFVSAAVGIGSVPSVGGLTVPHQLTFNFGKNSNFLEVGLGGTFWSGESNASGYTETLNSYQISPIIGYRKYLKNNFVIRVYANPLIHISGEYYIEDYSIIPYLGLSLGYTF